MIAPRKLPLLKGTSFSKLPESDNRLVRFKEATFTKGEFKSAPHISPGALCAASDPMAIQPDSGFSDKGIFFVHKAVACQPEPLPLWNFPAYSTGSLKWMQKLIKHEMRKMLGKHSKSDLRIFGEK